MENLEEGVLKIYTIETFENYCKDLYKFRRMEIISPSNHETYLNSFIIHIMNAATIRDLIA
jgi:hypothetical protein